MAYLTHEWAPNSNEPPWQHSEWVPELNRTEWRERGRNFLREYWVRQGGSTPDQLTALSQLPLEERLRHLWALGSDIGSVERDGLLYANLLEQLKDAIGADESSNDAAADEVVERMRAWGLSSAENMKPEHGGPPEPASPRPWRKVMDWLLSRLRDVSEILLKLVKAFWALVQDLAGATSISITVNVGLTPILGISFEPGVTTTWDWLAAFLSQIWDELSGSGAFAKQSVP